MEDSKPCKTGKCQPGQYQGAPGCERCIALQAWMQQKFGHFVRSAQPPEDFKLPDLKGDKP